jgi:general secretion pathway protein K
MSEKGSATLLSLLVSAVMITVGIGFNWVVKEHLKAAEGLKAKAEAMMQARSTYDGLIFSILSGQLTQKEIVFGGAKKVLGVQRIALGGPGVKLANEVFVRVQDSNNAISLVSPDLQVLRRLILLEGGDAETADTIVDSYLDWVDADDLSRVNGAESWYYRIQGKPYAPRNFPVQYKDELALVRGFDQKLYARVEPYLTVLPSTGLNLNTADDVMLRAYLDIDQEALDKLKNYRAQKPLGSETEIFAVTGKQMRRDPEGIYFFPSPFFDITIKVGTPRSLYTMNVGVDTLPRATSPYNVVYWREG